MRVLNRQWQTSAVMGWTLLVMSACGPSAAWSDEIRAVKKQAAGVQATRKAEAKAVEEKKAAPGEQAAAPGETAQALRKRLLVRAELSVDKVPLKELVEKLSKDYDIPMRLDEEMLRKTGIPLDLPITAKVKKGTLNTVLKKALSGAGLHMVVRDNEVLITRKDPDAPAEEKQVEVRAQAVVAGLAMAANDDQQIDQQALQFLRQFQTLERAELYFLGDVCGIDRAVTTKLKAGIETRAKAAARKYAGAQHRMMRGQGEAGGQRDARSLTQEGVLTALKDEAPPEELSKYEKQIGLRAEFRKAAAVRNLVGRLDRELVLSDAQREKFLEVLKEKWDDSWGRSMQLFIYGEQYYPLIPDAIVLPHLDAMQKEIWRGLPKQQNNIFFNGLGMMGNEIDEFPADDAEVQAGPQVQAAQEVRVIAVDAAPVEEEKGNEP